MKNSKLKIALLLCLHLVIFACGSMDKSISDIFK